MPRRVLTLNCLVWLPKDLGVQVTAVILTRFNICGSAQVLLWRPTYLSDADGYSMYFEQARGKIVRWRNMENLTLTFPVLSDDSAFGCIRVGNRG